MPGEFDDAIRAKAARRRGAEPPREPELKVATGKPEGDADAGRGDGLPVAVTFDEMLRAARWGR